MTGATASGTVRSDRIVVAGLPRSGTTYLGKILEQHPDVRMVLEPLNEEFGLRSVSGQFPYVGSRETSNGRAAAKTFDDLVALRGGWRRLVMSRGENRSAPRKVAKVLVGSRTSWEWRLDSVAERMGRPLALVQCVKDPFATFGLDYLASSFGIRSVCMVRHPGAYFQSFNAQPWQFGIDRLPSADEMRGDFGATVDADLWNQAKSDKLAYCAVLWKLMANYLRESDREEILTVRHEDFSRSMPEQAQMICAHFGLDVVPAMSAYIESTSSGSAVAPEYLKVHSFVRDSSAVADHWRGTIDPDINRRLQDAIGDDLHLMYEEW